ncbi:MAG: hypothetical protein AAFN10_17525 [Bacteroidota bacterium]
MINPLNHRYRLLLLGLLLGILTYGSMYQARQLWACIESTQQVKSKLQRVAQADQIFSQQAAQIRQIDQQLAILEVRELGLEDQLDFLQYLEGACRSFDLQLIALPQQQIEAVMDQYELSHERFRIEGKLSQMLSLLHQIELKDRVGSIQALHLELQQLRIGRQKKQLLVADVQLTRMIAHKSLHYAQ